MFSVFKIKVVTVATFDVVRSNASIGQGGGPECCKVREIQRERERDGEGDVT